MQIVVSRRLGESAMAIPEHKTKSVREATVDADGDVKLPDDILREVDWKQGDRVQVTIVNGDRIILSRRPDDVVERFAGALTHLYPEPGDIRRFLDEERASWVDFDRRFDD
jgi:bifunctional DNA-binding transcriptional regulator/antitoxin component of YhaV-PrlF toxin-antitoxin module